MSANNIGCGQHTKLQNLTVSHLNVRSLTANNDLGKRTEHINEFICKQFDCHLVACTETHLDNSVDDDDINIEGYFFLKKRSYKTWGRSWDIYKRGSEF